MRRRETIRARKAGEKHTVRIHWRELAKQYGLGRNAIEWMRPAFQICE
ncbi:MAG: hypothetical protein LIP11_04435 [Clostridiales bacterium]|nr:hypothetical protein [Clostridiales bacterium]